MSDRAEAMTWVEVLASIAAMGRQPMLAAEYSREAQASLQIGNG